MILVFTIIFINFYTAFGKDVRQTDTQIIKNAVLELKKNEDFQDRVILNINRLVEAQWVLNTACHCVWIILLDNKGKLEGNAEVEFISLMFEAAPDYDSYGHGGSKSHIVEKFIKQINEKLSNSIPLINFIQKDLIVTLEFADGDKVIFDGYYNDIKENLNYWYRKLNPDKNR